MLTFILSSKTSFHFLCLKFFINKRGTKQHDKDLSNQQQQMQFFKQHQEKKMQRTNFLIKTRKNNLIFLNETNPCIRFKLT